MTLASIFDSVGAGEWLLLLAVLLVVMGPKRLPGVLRKFGSQYAKFRRAADSFKRQLMEMDTEFERAVNSAEREVEEAAKIPDVTQPDESADAAPEWDDPDVPSDTPPEMPTRPPEEPVEPDGNRDTQEP